MQPRKKNALIQDVISIHERANLAKMLLRLFDLWKLDTTSRLILLGMSRTSRAMLSRYRQGEVPLSAAQDSLDRASWLLAIHQSLRILYPKNPELCYQWIHLPNAIFENNSPLNVMINEGLLGIAKVARYLQLQQVI